MNSLTASSSTVIIPSTPDFGPGIHDFRRAIGASRESYNKNVDKMVRDANTIMLVIYHDIYGRLAARKLILTAIPEKLKSGASDEEKVHRKKEIAEAYYGRYHEMLIAFGMDSDQYMVKKGDNHNTMLTLDRLSESLVNRFYSGKSKENSSDQDEESDDDSDRETNYDDSD